MADIHTKYTHQRDIVFEDLKNFEVCSYIHIILGKPTNRNFGALDSIGSLPSKNPYVQSTAVHPDQDQSVM